MRLFICVFAVISATALAGCDSSSESETFDLMLMDEDGAPVYAGALDLRIEDRQTDGPHSVTGTWRLDPVGGSAPLMVSSGAMTGSEFAGAISLSLDMNASDAGIDLDGAIDGERIAGAWASITIAGPQPRGTFEAVQR